MSLSKQQRKAAPKSAPSSSARAAEKFDELGASFSAFEGLLQFKRELANTFEKMCFASITGFQHLHSPKQQNAMKSISVIIESQSLLATSIDNIAMHAKLAGEVFKKAH